MGNSPPDRVPRSRLWNPESAPAHEVRTMRFVIHPPVDPARLAALWGAAPGAEWVNAADREEAAVAMPEADAFLGKITPELLARAERLRWVQAFTASLEHYLFPE